MISFLQKRKEDVLKKANTAYVILLEPELKKKKKSKTEAVVIATKVKEKEKVTPTNWSKGDNKKKMDKAVKDWLEKTGYRLNTNGEVIFTMNKFCHIVQIPINTFQKYVHIDPNTRRIITDGV